MGEFENYLKGKISDKIKKEIEIKVKNYEIYENIKTKIHTIIDKSKIFKSDNNLNKDHEKTLTNFNELNNFSIITKINFKLNTNDLDEFIEIIKYRPDYITKSENDFIDHGIASSLLLIEFQSIYFKIASKINLETNTNLVNLAFITETKKIAKFKKDILLPEVVFSIILHNINPKFIKNNNYRTDLIKEPFTFFSILCDSLQPWDRKRLYTLGYKKSLIIL